MCKYCFILLCKYSFEYHWMYPRKWKNVKCMLKFEYCTEECIYKL